MLKTSCTHFGGGILCLLGLPLHLAFVCSHISFLSFTFAFPFLEAAFCPFIFQLHLLNFLRFIAGFAILYQLFYFTMHDLSKGQHDLQIRGSLVVINLC